MFDVKDTDFFDLEEESFNTVIDPDVKFTGTIHFSKPLMIRGKVDGTIDATGDLVVDTGAVVNADIKAVRVLIRGKITGNINAQSLVFITQTGSLEGDIFSEQVVLEPGSMFTGKCTMVKRK
jgi:cytoskeletal protein CcmA (bactofilin family)